MARPLGSRKHQNKKGNLLELLLVSGIFHLALLVLFGAQSATQSVNKQKAVIVNAPEPIKAHLVFVSAPKPSAPPAPIMRTEPVITEPMEQAEATQADLPQPPVPTPIAKEVSQASPQPQTPNLVPTEPVLSNNVSAKSQTRQALRHFLNQQHRQQLSRLSEQASRDYQRQKVSPKLNLPAPKQALTTDEALRKEQSVKVDCSSAVNKSLAILSGFAGGTFDCIATSNAQGYIQNRLNKKLSKGMRNQLSSPAH